MRNVVTSTPAMVRTPSGVVQVPVKLEYTDADPFAVALTISDRVTWLFARELLADAFDAPAGDGDVRVSVTETCVSVSLSSPTGRGLVEVPVLAVTQFLAASYGMVARGAEQIDVDAMLTSLSSPTN